MTNEINLHITEIFNSIQGESTLAGRACTFVRLTGCNLRCTYCDTEYAFHGGTKMSIDAIMAQVDDYGTKLVEITGGEPLLQKKVVHLAERLLKDGYEVAVETGGSLDISLMPKGCKMIVDIKTPDSKMSHKNDWSNIERLRPSDEVKFVIASEADYHWSLGVLSKYKLTDICEVLFSAVHDDLSQTDLAQWILRDKLNVRFQVQLHKILWPASTQGV